MTEENNNVNNPDINKKSDDVELSSDNSESAIANEEAAQIQKRLTELEDEINTTDVISTDTPEEALQTQIANESEKLSKSELDDEIKQASEIGASHQLKKTSKTTGLEGISTKDLSLEAIDEDIKEGKDELDCLNCASPLQGPYCHNCGQPDRHFIRFFPKVLWEMINEAFDLDSKVLRTLMPLLFYPGRLSMEYIAGRRARYVNPLRLYIILSVLFFISISLFTNTDDNFTVTDTNGVTSRVRITDDDSAEERDLIIKESLDEQRKVLSELEDRKASGIEIPDDVIEDTKSRIEKLEEGKLSHQGNSIEGLVTEDGKLDVEFDDGTKWDVDTNPIHFNNLFSEETTLELNQFLWSMGLKLDKAVKEDSSELIDEFFNAIPQLMFILLPLFALLLKVTYIFKKRYYMEHLIVALHSHCFIFLSLLLLIIFSSIDERLYQASWYKDALGYISIALIIWMPLNIYITQKRIYAQGYFITTLKFIFIGVSYFAMLGLTAALAFVVGLVSL